MSPEMVGILIGAVISGAELLVSLTGIILSGNLEINCCGLSIRHRDIESELVDELKETRRASSCPPPDNHVED